MKFDLLGDPHLGRAFKTGVPLHRIGEREAMVWCSFGTSLFEADKPLHINMGDLFDKFVVPPEVLLEAARLYRQAAKSSPNTTFVVLRGNHDVSRDVNRASSFDIFKALMEDVLNVLVVSDTHVVIDNMGFVPFDPWKSAAEQVADLPDGLDMIFTHFDFLDWGGIHVLPTELLASKGILKVYNGHDHIAREETRHGVSVTMTGSLQPYSHAEDPLETFYRTVTLAELDGLETKNLNVRVLLAEGEALPEGLDCLSLVAKRAPTSVEDTEVDTAEFDSFDLSKALEDLLPMTIRAEVMEVFRK